MSSWGAVSKSAAARAIGSALLLLVLGGVLLVGTGELDAGIFGVSVAIPAAIAFALARSPNIATSRHGLILARRLGVVCIFWVLYQVLRFRLYEDPASAFTGSAVLFGLAGASLPLLAGLLTAPGSSDQSPIPPGGTADDYPLVANLLLAGPVLAVLVAPTICFSRVSAAEALAIGDLRSLVTAESEYAKSHNGDFTTIECLLAPRDCGGHRNKGLIPKELGTAVRRHYVFTFIAGTSIPAAVGYQAEPRLSSFAYVAIPIDSSGRFGARGFCADATGALRAGKQGVVPTVIDTRCPAALTLLE
jgi:hypothetical protein